MVTKLSALNEAKRLLTDCNIPDWQLSAEYILAVALRVEHSDMYKIKSLTDRQYKRYLKLITLRTKHVPLDKLLDIKNSLISRFLTIVMYLLLGTKQRYWQIN